MSSKIKIWGCRRSGTTWTANTIRLNTSQNVDVLQHNAFWKHAPYVRLPDIDLDVCLAKHPHSWLQSILRYYDGSEVQGRVKVRTMAENWANLNLSYLEAEERWHDVRILRYEDMLEAPEEEISSILDQVGVDASDISVNYRTKVPTDVKRESYHETSLEEFKDFYLNDGYYSLLSKDEVRAFNDQLHTIKHGPTTVDRLGYDMTPPSYMQ